MVGAGALTATILVVGIAVVTALIAQVVTLRFRERRRPC
jgi:hypothetical protein